MRKERMSYRRAKQICDYGIGYCNAQYLLTDLTPCAYVIGREGWRCDIYILGPVTISTGYCPIGKKISYDTIRKYEKIAENIVCEEVDFRKCHTRLSMLRCDLIRELRNHESD